MTSSKDAVSHSLALEDAMRLITAKAGGLTAAEAARRLVAHGPNRLPETRARGPFLRFLTRVHNVLIHLLLAAAAVTAALQHWVDTGVILANAAIGFIQEGKAEAAMVGIRLMLAPRAAVLRDGRRVSVDGADLVPGDVVLLEAGDKVPADLRIIEARGLAAQEAILTGESVPVEKAFAPVPADAALAGRGSACPRSGLGGRLCPHEPGTQVVPGDRAAGKRPSSSQRPSLRSATCRRCRFFWEPRPSR